MLESRPAGCSFATFRHSQLQHPHRIWLPLHAVGLAPYLMHIARTIGLTSGVVFLLLASTNTDTNDQLMEVHPRVMHTGKPSVTVDRSLCVRVLTKPQIDTSDLRTNARHKCASWADLDTRIFDHLSGLGWTPQSRALNSSMLCVSSCHLENMHLYAI